MQKCEGRLQGIRNCLIWRTVLKTAFEILRTAHRSEEQSDVHLERNWKSKKFFIFFSSENTQTHHNVKLNKACITWTLLNVCIYIYIYVCIVNTKNHYSLQWILWRSCLVSKFHIIKDHCVKQLCICYYAIAR